MRKGYTWLLIEPEHARDTQPSVALPSSAASADIAMPPSMRAGRAGRGTEGADRTPSPAVINEERDAARYDETDSLQWALSSAAWLFVRGEESIRITRHPTRTTLRVYGPGLLQNSHEFESTASLEKFRQSYEERVLRNGWVLLKVTDRRASGRGR